ncbi:hypothetical protein [Caldicellulosiruptor bescii]|uniref:hypothetical protein n=1 Tax=Caldicellulosiruptor bescii TaxID=31899 RepID=UPI0002F060D3|nr:hypothetical protein [Caldicellulosiruptor bescii]
MGSREYDNQAGRLFDKSYGTQYIVEGYKDLQTGMKVRFFYLRKNSIGLWEITTVGTGP